MLCNIIDIICTLQKKFNFKKYNETTFIWLYTYSFTKVLIFLTLQNPYIFINKFLLQKIYKKNISTFQVKLH